jgi:hypothetical protein
MSDFPSITPNAISFDFGTLNTSNQPTVSTGPVRFRRSLKASGNQLQLTYTGLSQSQVDELRQHYADSDGMHNLFNVPSSVWGGYQSVAGASVYRYLEAPQEEHTGLFYNVTIALRIITGWFVQSDLIGPPALEPAPFDYSTFFLTGVAPFRVVAPSAALLPAPTLIFTARGAAG